MSEMILDQTLLPKDLLLHYYFILKYDLMNIQCKITNIENNIKKHIIDKYKIKIINILQVYTNKFKESTLYKIMKVFNI